VNLHFSAIPLDDPDLLFGETIQFVHQPIDLRIRGGDLAPVQGLVRRNGGGGELLV